MSWCRRKSRTRRSPPNTSAMARSLRRRRWPAPRRRPPEWLAEWTAAGPPGVGCSTVAGISAWAVVSVATRSIWARTSAVALAVSTMASAKRRTGNSSGSGDRSINCWARSAVCRSPWLCGIRMALDSMATVSASSARVAAGMSAMAARLPAVASRSTVSSASNNHSARSSPLTPGHSAPGLTRSSIWAWTINAVPLSRPVRIRSRRSRRSSSWPPRTMSAVVSTTIAILARSDRMLSRRTLSGRSGIRKALQTKLHRLPTRVAPISHGSSENFARRYSEKK